MPKPSTRNGFTLIELLIVIAIIGILMGLLFPAVSSAIDAARKGQAQNDVTQIATAVIAYETEYGHMPGGAGPSPLNAGLLSTLTATNTNTAAVSNPRLISFIEAPTFKKGKGGVSNDGAWYDPWGKPYYITMDANYTNSVGGSTNGSTSIGTNLNKRVAVWNIETNTRYQVRSW